MALDIEYPVKKINPRTPNAIKPVGSKSKLEGGNNALKTMKPMIEPKIKLTILFFDNPQII